MLKFGGDKSGSVPGWLDEPLNNIIYLSPLKQTHANIDYPLPCAYGCCGASYACPARRLTRQVPTHRAPTTGARRWATRNRVENRKPALPIMRGGVSVRTVINGLTFDVTTKDVMQQAGKRQVRLNRLRTAQFWFVMGLPCSRCRRFNRCVNRRYRPSRRKGRVGMAILLLKIGSRRSWLLMDRGRLFDRARCCSQVIPCTSDAPFRAFRTSYQLR